jgi:hypothetical protein
MRSRTGVVRMAQAVFLALTLVVAFAATAQAAEVVFSPQNDPPKKEDGWQAGTCNTPTCTPESNPAQFYETAGGHPPFGMTEFTVRHEEGDLIPGDPHEEPLVDMKTLRVDLPVGLSVNPGATPQCASPKPSECKTSAPLSQVGESWVTVSPEFPLAPPIEVKAPVFNLVPKFGQPARFGFTVEAIPIPVPGNPVAPPNDIFLEADVAWESDFHEGFTIKVPKVEHVKLLRNRLVFNGNKNVPPGEGFFITTPSTCFDPTSPAHAHTYSTYARADSLQNPDPLFPNGSPYVESKLPPGTSPKKCATIPFNPSIGVNPGTNEVDAPAGATIEVKLPVEPDPKGQETSPIRTAKVVHPLGMGLNPSAANGLAACTDAQFGKGTRNPVACPPASKVGTTTVETPPLPEGPLTGNVYVGQQLSRDPESGKTFRIFVHAASARYGVDVRLIGEVIANRKTGQLTAVFDDPPKVGVLRGGNSDNLPHGLPQVPFTTFRITLDGGPRAALSSPPTCGPNLTTSQLTPWSAMFGGKSAAPSSNFNLTSLPGGGPCPKTMAERPFAPGFAAAPKTNQAKAFTPFATYILRPPGQQELKGLDITLPKGATAKLKGVAYCPPAAIASAETRSGVEEKAAPSCPQDSRIGVASVQAGTGSAPLRLDGTAYLAGPHEGAPVSVVVVTPSVAGPFDLGNVVVRVPLFLNPETAQITARTKSIPDVYGGTKLDIRSIFLNVNRDDFTLNGTNCRKGATAGVINGGGADPSNPAAFSAFPVSADFRATGCKKLKFRPKLSIRLFGATQRNKHPRLRAVLKARAKDANIRRASVALPHALFLDQSSLATVCTRVQFAADKCPKRSIYGRARAFSPLLAKPLEGPVYLRSSDNPLPDMVAHLDGQVEIDLVGRIDSFQGGIRTTFDRVPDVPVKKFVMTLPGGKKGLLVASTNLCAKPVKGIVKLKAQNSRKANRKITLRTPCKGKKGQKSKRSGK